MPAAIKQRGERRIAAVVARPAALSVHHAARLKKAGRDA